MNDKKTLLQKICPDLEYVKCGDYYIPNIVGAADMEDFPEQKKLNRWGQMYDSWFESVNPVDYDHCSMVGEMNPHSYEVGIRAEAMYQNICDRLKRERNYDAIQKQNYHEAIQLLQEIQSIAEEIVINEVIHDYDDEWMPEFAKN